LHERDWALLRIHCSGRWPDTCQPPSVAEC
jgi:hypothetical protein